MEGKSKDSIEYFNKIHFRRHSMLWKYDTNKFIGCNCGSQEFNFETTRNGNYVTLCLKCKECGDKWSNLWTETHPFTKASIMVYDLLENIEQNKKEERYLAAEKTLKQFITEIKM